ncbi:MAG: DNA-binding protein [Candidatus Pacearchaeota archaeon]
MNEISNELETEFELAKNLKIIENVAKLKMSKEAIVRYGNLKLAHPEKAIKIISFIAEAVQQGRIKEIITDEQFKEILMKI